MSEPSSSGPKEQTFIKINVVDGIEKPQIPKKEPKCLSIRQCKDILFYAHKVDALSTEWLSKNKGRKGIQMILLQLHTVSCSHSLPLCVHLKYAEQIGKDIDWDEKIIREQDNIKVKASHDR